MFHRILTISALLLVAVLPAHATTTFCVNDVAGFRAALNFALGNTSTTLIKVARGTYHLAGSPLRFQSTAGSQGQFDISGGYNADCSAQILNPALTIIDGDAGQGGIELISTGGISVRYLTIQNSRQAGGLFVSSTQGGVIVNYNIMRNNSSPGNSGMSISVTDMSATSDIHVEGNLVVGNTGTSNGTAAGSFTNSGTGSTYITNNTIADNVFTGTSVGDGGVFIAQYAGSTTVVSNNIIWGNTGDDLELYGNPLLVDNDYGTTFGTPSTSSSGNDNVDPRFSAAGDYHLGRFSPLLAAGTIAPAGNLPTIDIEGHPRSYNNLVDMGAYERGNEIFADSFDH
jgi:hypothetical protein